MRAPLTLAIAAALLLAMSCDGTTAPQRHGQPSHLFRADAATIHDSLYSFCGIEGELPVQRLSLPPWNGQGTVTLYRWVATTHGVIASRQIAVTVSFGDRGLECIGPHAGFAGRHDADRLGPSRGT